MLTGGRKEKRDAVATITKGRTAIALLGRKRAALRAIIQWERDLSKGKVTSLEDIARNEGLSKRRLLNVIRNDEGLQKELFEPAMVEARLGLIKAVRQAYVSIDDQDVQAADQRGWAEFLAKLLGGAYDKKQAAGTNLIIANLIPQLPPQLAHLSAQVVEAREVTVLSDLGA